MEEIERPYCKEDLLVVRIEFIGLMEFDEGLLNLVFVEICDAELMVCIRLVRSARRGAGRGKEIIITRRKIFGLVTPFASQRTDFFSLFLRYQKA